MYKNFSLFWFTLRSTIRKPVWKINSDIDWWHVVFMFLSDSVSLDGCTRANKSHGPPTFPVFDSYGSNDYPPHGRRESVSGPGLPITWIYLKTSWILNSRSIPTSDISVVNLSCYQCHKTIVSFDDLIPAFSKSQSWLWLDIMLSFQSAWFDRRKRLYLANVPWQFDGSYYGLHYSWNLINWIFIRLFACRFSFSWLWYHTKWTLILNSQRNRILYLKSVHPDCKLAILWIHLKIICKIKFYLAWIDVYDVECYALTLKKICHSNRFRHKAVRRIIFQIQKVLYAYSPIKEI